MTPLRLALAFLAQLFVEPAIAPFRRRTADVERLVGQKKERPSC